MFHRHLPCVRHGWLDAIIWNHLKTYSRSRQRLPLTSSLRRLEHDHKISNISNRRYAILWAEFHGPARMRNKEISHSLTFLFYEARKIDFCESVVSHEKATEQRMFLYVCNTCSKRKKHLPIIRHAKTDLSDYETCVYKKKIINTQIHNLIQFSLNWACS